MIYRSEAFLTTPGWLVLSDKTAFELEILTRGQIARPGVIATGEVVFNTALTGYQEIVTDPSYCGQFITFTNPHIGNYGCAIADMESAKVWANAVIVRDYSELYSNYRAERSLLELLESSGVPLVSSLDTRALTRHIRSHGALGALIGVGDPAELASFVSEGFTTTGKDLASAAGTPTRRHVQGPGPRVVAIDYGMKASIVTRLAQHFDVVVMPPDSSATDVLSESPDGVFLSNGPGDPGAISYSNAQIQGLVGRVPLFGICLGHQLLARAIGAATYKLEFGHHGGNHPVSRLADRVVEITSQNHNYAVDRDSLVGADRGASVTHLSLNDGVVEGFSLPKERAFSVQYHPEAAPGPHDSYYLFEQFKEEVVANA